MPYFRKKPFVIEAVQYMGRGNFANHAVPEWMWQAFGAGTARAAADGIGLEIITMEGTHYALPGDFIIRGVKGELRPCKPDIFAATYEPAPTPTETSPDDE